MRNTSPLRLYKMILFTASLLCFHITLVGQEANYDRLEHGILLSVRGDNDKDFDLSFKGYGVEGGYYFLKRSGPVGSISLDIRIAYGKSNHTFQNLIMDHFTHLFDTLRTLHSGTLAYRGLSISFPIKYRAHFSNRSPFFFLVGFNPYFSLVSKSTWNYDETVINRYTNEIISERNDQVEPLKQRYSQDLILAGIGMEKKKLLVDLYFSGGSTNFRDGSVGFINRLSLVLNCHYRLSK